MAGEGEAATADTIVGTLAGVGAEVEVAWELVEPERSVSGRGGRSGRGVA